MVCYHPLSAWAVPGGGITFRRREGLLGQLDIACGQCTGCRLERSRQWAVRLMHEAEMHEKSCFVTLTYRDRDLPPRGTLQFEDIQKFLHRLRKRLGPFRYFHCGEYGEKRGRPHYHLALFNLDFEEDRRFKETTDQGDSLYESPLLNHVWGLGDRNLIGELTFKSAAYIARYIMGKITGNRAERHYGQVVSKVTGLVTPYRKPEYITMSLKPGIGKSWIKKYVDDVYPRDEVVVRGKVCKPPKYYDQHYAEVNPEGYEALKARRVKEGLKHAEDNTPERLAIKEELQEAERRHFTRNKM